MPHFDIRECCTFQWAITTYYKVKLWAHQLRVRLSSGTDASELDAGTVNAAPLRDIVVVPVGDGLSDVPALWPPHRPTLTRTFREYDVGDTLHNYETIPEDDWMNYLPSDPLNLITTATCSATRGLNNRHSAVCDHIGQAAASRDTPVLPPLAFDFDFEFGLPNRIASINTDVEDLEASVASAATAVDDEHSGEQAPVQLAGLPGSPMRNQGRRFAGWVPIAF